MTKIFGIAVVAGLLTASPLFAGGKDACCAKNAANESKGSCMDLTSLNVTAGQKAKLEKWRQECAQAGCTKQSRAAFLEKAKGILSPRQYRKVQEQCDKLASHSEITTAARGTGYFRHARTELPFRSVVGVQAAQGPFLTQPH